MKLLDTTFLIDLLQGEESTLAVLKEKQQFATTQINMYEIIRGIFLSGGSGKEKQQILELFEDIRILPLNERGILKSSEISANLIQKGKMLEDCDCLIAGIGLSFDIDTIVTRNVKDFGRIKQVKVEGY